MNRILLAAVFLALIGAVFYWGYASLAGVSIGPAMRGGAVKEFTIKTFQYGFDPSNITVDHGDTVVLNVIDTDVPHGIGIAEFGIITRGTDIGKPARVSFVADKVGTFTYYCTVYCGEGHESMVSGKNKGVLIVRPVEGHGT